MKTKELIKKLEEVLAQYGDIECLIEVMSDDVVCLRSVDELNFEDRDGYGPSITLLC